MTEACAYPSPSQEPADIAERLRAYIARNEAHARRHVEGETDQPKIQHGYVTGLLTGIKRMEHQMRCFILFSGGAADRARPGQTAAARPLPAGRAGPVRPQRLCPPRGQSAPPRAFEQGSALPLFHHHPGV